MPGTPLPRQYSSPHKSALSAYSKVLEFETVAENHPDPLYLQYARILGYLLIYFPTDTALSTVTHEVLSCTSDDALAQSGKFYFDYYIRIFFKYKGRTPVPSAHASRSSFDTTKALFAGGLPEPLPNHADAKDKALIRDGFRCIISGSYDRKAATEDPELLEASEEEGWVLYKTECAHIFPESPDKDISEDPEKDRTKLDYAPSVWAVLDRFGYPAIRTQLNGNGIYGLQNVMTLFTDLHDMFDCLDVWFEALPGHPNTYKLQARFPCTIKQYPAQVKFAAKKYPATSKYARFNDAVLPLPDPDYLKIHAACCRVAHLSGSSDYLVKLYHDRDRTLVLAQDGSSKAVLEEALLKLGSSSEVH